jgi:prevent-host-death family protein
MRARPGTGPRARRSPLWPRRQSNIFEAKNRLAPLIKSAQAGEEVVIANRGEPVARLVPARETLGAASAAGSAGAILYWLERYPLPDYARRSSEEIDAAIEQERQSWD